MTIIQIAIILISIIVTVWVGTILSKQIKSQNTIIENLKDYINTTNWKEVQKFYDEFKIPAEKEITRQQIIEEYGNVIRDLERPLVPLIRRDLYIYFISRNIDSQQIFCWDNERLKTYTIETWRQQTRAS